MMFISIRYIKTQILQGPSFVDSSIMDFLWKNKFRFTLESKMFLHKNYMV